MGDPLLDTARRWLELVGNRPIEDESFTPYDFWMHAQPAMEWVGTNTPLSPAQVLVLAELAQRLGGAADLGPALEENFGSCPWGESAMRAFSAYLKQQLNGFTAAQPRKGPSLSGEAAEAPPPQVSDSKLWGG